MSLAGKAGQASPGVVGKGSFEQHGARTHTHTQRLWRPPRSKVKPHATSLTLDTPPRQPNRRSSRRCASSQAARGELSSKAAGESSKMRAPPRRAGTESARGNVREEAVQQKHAMGLQPGASGGIGHRPEHDTTGQRSRRGGEITSSLAHGSAMQMRSGVAVISQRAREDQIQGIDQACWAGEKQINLGQCFGNPNPYNLSKKYGSTPPICTAVRPSFVSPYFPGF